MINRSFDNNYSWIIFYEYISITLISVLVGFVSSGRTRHWNKKTVSAGIHRVDWEIKFLVYSFFAIINGLVQWSLFTSSNGKNDDDDGDNLVGVENLFFMIYSFAQSFVIFSALRIIRNFKVAFLSCIFKILINITRLILLIIIGDIASIIICTILIVLLDLAELIVYFRAMKLQQEMIQYQALNKIDDHDDILEGEKSESRENHYHINMDDQKLLNGYKEKSDININNDKYDISDSSSDEDNDIKFNDEYNDGLKNNNISNGNIVYPKKKSNKKTIFLTLPKKEPKKIQRKNDKNKTQTKTKKNVIKL